MKTAVNLLTLAANFFTLVVNFPQCSGHWLCNLRCEYLRKLKILIGANRIIRVPREDEPCLTKSFQSNNLINSTNYVVITGICLSNTCLISATNCVNGLFITQWTPWRGFRVLRNAKQYAQAQQIVTISPGSGKRATNSKECLAACSSSADCNYFTWVK